MTSCLTNACEWQDDQVMIYKVFIPKEYQLRSSGAQGGTRTSCVNELLSLSEFGEDKVMCLWFVEWRVDTVIVDNKDNKVFL